MIALEEAQAAILAACARVPAAQVDIADALGCVLAEEVVAGESVPPFANSAMDGFAVRAADTAAAPVDLAVIGTVAAGAAADVVVGPGQSLRIMTGAPIPAGADAVVMVERTEDAGGGRVRILAAAGKGDHVRPAGDDIASGQTVFEAGTVLGPGHVGVLAGIGHLVVRAYPRLRVGVLSTGDELRSDGGDLGPGQIRDSNRPMLLGLLRQEGCRPVDLGSVGDSEDAITAAVRDGLARCDALVTSGGVSVGDFDHMKSVLGSMGTMNWWQVAIRPAKPLAFGTVDGKPVFGLPGNPVSAMVSFEMFAAPGLRSRAGLPRIHRPRWPAVADVDFTRRSDGKLHLVRVQARMGDDGRIHLANVGPQGSHQLWSAAAANALAFLPDGPGVAAGEEVQVMVTGTL